MIARVHGPASPQVELQVVAEASLASELYIPGSGPWIATATYGVGVAEVEVDALTGEHVSLPNPGHSSADVRSPPAWGSAALRGTDNVELAAYGH